ncbi:TadE/TadG family type IV pilus assembly protein, partial [Rhizobium sp. BK377]|uniref:TadE/TadG family type IV pilus assembly protein n=1 Tax=Rhizobium sp. BK377 TaxID=2587058 RepID=UPI003917F460
MWSVIVVTQQPSPRWRRGFDMMRRFIFDRSGNFGIMTALLLVPILGAAGTAIDF